WRKAAGADLFRIRLPSPFYEVRERRALAGELRISFTMHSGGRAPRLVRGGRGLFRVLRRALPPGGAMTDLAADFVTLSLLPVLSWRDAGERLRAGEPPSAILDRWLASRAPFESDLRSML